MSEYPRPLYSHRRGTNLELKSIGHESATLMHLRRQHRQKCPKKHVLSSNSFRRHVDHPSLSSLGRRDKRRASTQWVEVCVELRDLFRDGRDDGGDSLWVHLGLSLGDLLSELSVRRFEPYLCQLCRWLAFFWCTLAETSHLQRQP